jgi:hypothetical protein
LKIRERITWQKGADTSVWGRFYFVEKDEFFIFAEGRT